MKLLVFGPTGAMGTALEEACRVARIDFTGIPHVDADVTDADRVADIIRGQRPNAVVNCVAMIGNGPCEAAPARAFDVNANAAYYMAGACAELGAAFVQPSSHAVFDGTKDGPYTEDDLPRPVNIYAGSKLAAEQFALGLCAHAYVVRLPTLFGPRRNAGAGFADKMFGRLRAGQTVKVAADKIDSPTYTMDAAGRILEILAGGLPSGVYHVANDGAVSYHEFIRRLAELAGCRGQVVACRDADFPAPGRKPLRTAMRSVKLPPMRRWEDALADYVGRLENVPPGPGGRS